MLERYSNTIAEHLIPRTAYRPFPRYGESGWRALDASAANAAALSSGKSWPILPAVRYMDFFKDGNRSRYEAVYFERRSALASFLIGECIEGKGRFLNDIIDLAWAVCEETSWVIPAHNSHGIAHARALPDIRADIYIDLFSAATGSLLSWLWYFMHEALDRESPLIAQRIEHEVKRRILDPYLSSDFHWMGLDGNTVNNWNPWINSNVLPAFLIIEADEVRRVNGIQRTLASVDRFLAGYDPDGGCDEGPGYWNAAGASLFDHLDMLNGATNGAVDVFRDPLIANIGRYIMRMHIAGNYFVNFADSAAAIHVSADLIHRYGKAVGDDDLAAFGASFFSEGAPKTSDSWMFFRTLCALFNAGKNKAVQASPPLLGHAWMDGIAVMTARHKAGSTEGFFVAAKGGHNAESHNHNDVGSFIVYADGEPVIIDAGVETYTKKTFSKDRYDIWTMRSSYHNLPTVNGVEQQAGSTFRARAVHCTKDNSRSSLTMDIASAYPLSAGIERYERSIVLDRSAHTVTITDDFLLHNEGEVVISIMTAAPLIIHGQQAVTSDERIVLTAGGMPCVMRAETITIEDGNLRGVWGDTLTRLLISLGTVERGTFTLRVAKA